MNRISVVIWAVFLSLVLICSQAAAAETVETILHDSDGEKVGTVKLIQEDDGVIIAVEIQNFEPGFHGFHIHETGLCEPPFTTAGGHYNPEGKDHPHHAGDLPVLLVNSDGRAYMVFRTDRFKLEDLLEGDGTAFIIHEKPDNFANIPERYVSEPDRDTLDTGDSGGRLACGVIAEEQ